ncbi:hypothetical protein MMC07_009217 [Pseudocyphellaria aurata]|nr:hypothetical protein [Pseudocyphellaria aurata]
MSNPGGTGDPASDLQGLFASLRTSAGGKSFAASKDGSPAQTLSRQPYPFDIPGSSSSTQPQLSEQRQTAAMSPSFVPLNGQQSRSVPSNLSNSRSATPAATGDRPNVDRTANLLNLLKFSTPTASQTQPQQQPPLASGPRQGSFQASSSPHSVHGRGISASDLVASFMGKSSTPTPRESIPAPSATNHQDFLLKLLNRTNPSQSPGLDQGGLGSPGARDGQGTTQDATQDLAAATMIKKQPSSVASDKHSVSSASNDSPIRVFGSSDDREPTPFEPQDLPKGPSVPKKSTKFTYVNPFDQLAASSPRNAKLTSVNGDDNKRKISEPSPKSNQITSRRKLNPTGHEILQSIELPTPTPLKDERTQIEALEGLGAPTRNTETVAEALNEVGSQVDKEVEIALVKAEQKEDELKIKQEELDDAQDTIVDALEEKVQDLAVEVKLELDKEENQGALEESLPKPIADAVHDAIDAVARGDGADDWESAEGGEPGPNIEAERVVPVYQFPMKPFVSIDITQKELPGITFHDASMTNIARLKKEFDQIDRTLATATNDFIVYGSPRAGLKVIRQDDGLAQHVFSETHDRIFNVSISTTSSLSRSQGAQSLIATGVSGTVYWTTILKPGEEISGHDMEEQGLIFPPSPAAPSDSSSTGQLKTRAKKSSRNPDFFAIGRGKSIHIVFPAHARKSKYLSPQSVIDTEKYFKDRSLKISTGKAGKDFIFSEDDTTILTLDKTGRLRFWDIRDLVDIDNAFPSTLAPVEAKAPIMTFVTARSNEKSWPTSVLLVDKPRPYTKGIALRYVVVGMKQNHTLQLWDLCLGKSVQEVHFPHEKESDAICSVSYHPTSGIVVVGHPTRNSIYLIHLSAPKYNLPPISQARFVQRLANKDSSLPKPEATAILSGLREYSFSNIGQLRSVELVSIHSEPMRLAEDADDPVLFELYIMHSKGVTCLAIKKEDLGWSKDSKVIHPVEAEENGYVVVKELKEPQLGYFSDPSSNNGDPQPVVATSTNIASKPLSKAAIKAMKKRDTQSEVFAVPPVIPASTPNPGKTEKKKKRSGAVADAAAREIDAAGPPSLTTSAPEIYPAATQPQPSSTTQLASGIAKEVTRPSIPTSASPDAPESTAVARNEHLNHQNKIEQSAYPGTSSDILEKELKKIEAGVSEEFNKVLSRELGTLYQRFSEDKRVQDAAGAAKQDAILRLVSSTLGDNVEKELSRIITTNIQEVVLPSLTDTTSSLLDKRVSEVLTQQLHHAIPPLLKLALPEAISRGVQNTEVLRMIAEQITTKVTGHVEKDFNSTLHNTIVPAFKQLAINLAQKSTVDTENRVHEYLRRAEAQHREDTSKIDQLSNLVRGLSESIHMMAAAQTDFQQEILNLQQQAAQDRRGDTSSQSHGHRGSTEVALTHKSPEQEELDTITTLMSEGRFEEGTIQWIQSNQQAALYDNYLVRFNPSYLQQLPPLVVFSVGAAVTSSLENNVMERLAWLETVFATVDPYDPEIRDVAPRIIDVLSQRLEGEYMRIAEGNPHDPSLRKIAALARHARELKGFGR